MNALNAALQLLARASTALERHHDPSVEDVEESLDQAKDAVKILKSAFDLMSEGIYEVAEEPQSGTPLPFEENVHAVISGKKGA